MAGNLGFRWSALSVLLAVAVAAPASATTLIRMGLEDLVTSNSMVVVGEVLEAESRWTEDASFVVTDVRLAVHDVLKGRLDGHETELTVTQPGGRIGKRSHIVVGSADLVPGNSYVLFLSKMDLAGNEGSLVIRDLIQGAFDIRIGKDGLRAISQAITHPLLPDRSGKLEAPGGVEGIPINTLLGEVRQIVARQGARREVK